MRWVKILGAMFVFSMAVIPAGSLPNVPQAQALITTDDAQPQGVFPHYRWDWNNDLCSDFFDIAPDSSPQIHLGDCSQAAWIMKNPVNMGRPGYEQFLLVGDWDVDGCKDMVTINYVVVSLLRGDCATGFKPGVDVMGTYPGYDYWVAPGLWTGDFLPDILARNATDGRLMLFVGDGARGFTGDPTEIGQGWGVADVIVGLGDFNNDVCADLAARYVTDHTMHFYPGNCAGGFQQINPPTLASDFENFEFMVAGGDWFRVAGQTCTDMMGWNDGAPTGLVDKPGNCNGQMFIGGGAFSGANPLVPPFPSDNTHMWVWGDTDCSASVGPRDGQSIVRFFLGLEPLSSSLTCPHFPGLIVVYGGEAYEYSDWDCSGAVAPRDAQAAIAFFLDNVPLTQTEPCPELNARYLFGES